MKIRLIDVDSHNFPNLALMKISAYHKSKGDDVAFYNPLFDIDTDLIYQSKVFSFSPDYDFVYPTNCKVIKGGSGYGLDNYLPDEIENIYPDYLLYNIKDVAYGFTSRGCIRNCQFCIVQKKEGKFRPVSDIYQFWNGQKNLVLLDNNLTASHKHFELILNQLIKEKIKVDFSQGLDIRLITHEMAVLLSKVKLLKQIHFAFDDIKLEKNVINGIKILLENGVKSYKLMFYVLIGFNSTQEEDLHRVELLRSFGVAPFVMPYNKKDQYQKRFARWVNHKAIFNSVSWEKYKQ